MIWVGEWYILIFSLNLLSEAEKRESNTSFIFIIRKYYLSDHQNEENSLLALRKPSKC